MKEEDLKTSAQITDDQIKTERTIARRSFLSRAGIFLFGASAVALSTGGNVRRSTTAERAGDRKDSDVNRMADSHICDSDSKDARCDNDTRKFRDPKSSDSD